MEGGDVNISEDKNVKFGSGKIWTPLTHAWRTEKNSTWRVVSN
jgi:hypothetical protein